MLADASEEARKSEASSPCSSAPAVLVLSMSAAVAAAAGPSASPMSPAVPRLVTAPSPCSAAQRSTGTGSARPRTS